MPAPASGILAAAIPPRWDRLGGRGYAPDARSAILGDPTIPSRGGQIA